MSHIRSKNTKPELMLKEKLKGSYLRYQPKMFGRPDFASKKKKIAIFIDGCFWHKCPKCYKQPTTNREYWIDKVKRNTARDNKITRELETCGWTVIRFWEHEVLEDPHICGKKVLDILNSNN